MKKLFWITFFSIAMGYLESSVVVYIRALYYPGGFSFPMVSLPVDLTVTEVIREACTIIMLIAAGILAGNTKMQRFAWFLYCFAVWDIFYYIFLKLLINWPESLLTWDILFLIPMVWTGPVIAPVISSLTMILLALAIIYRDIEKPSRAGVSLVIAGAFVIFVSYIWDFAVYMLQRHAFSELFNYRINQKILEQYIPERFNWMLFIAGEIIILTGIFTEAKKKKFLHAP
jgi:hypothetical protein